MPGLRLSWLSVCVCVCVWLFGWGEGLSVCFPYQKKNKTKKKQKKPEKHNVREILENVRKKSRTNLAARGCSAAYFVGFVHGSSACAELAQKPSCFHRVSSFEVPCKHVSMGLLIISVNHSRIRLPPWGQCPGSPASFTSCPSAPFPAMLGLLCPEWGDLGSSGAAAGPFRASLCMSKVEDEVSFSRTGLL